MQGSLFPGGALKDKVVATPGAFERNRQSQTTTTTVKGLCQTSITLELHNGFEAAVDHVRHVDRDVVHHALDAVVAHDLGIDLVAGLPRFVGNPREEYDLVLPNPSFQPSGSKKRHQF